MNKTLSLKEKLEKAKKTDNVQELIELSFESLPAIRFEVAQNNFVNIEILNRLSKDQSWQVRWKVAMNPNSDVAILDILSTDDIELVRKAAKSKKTKCR
ncbi:MAG: hypothetical protein ACRDCC_07610 [Culicoidibacterales bacterium]